MERELSDEAVAGDRFGRCTLPAGDGAVDAWRGTPGMQVPTFVERLRRAGFDPQPVDPQGGGNAAVASGFFSYLLKHSPAAATEASP